MPEPRELAVATEHADVPSGRYGERFGGYAVLGVPFRSGHVLGLRRFPASSLGEPYTTVWHRDPSRRWSIYHDVPAERACPRYFDAALDRTVRTDIEVVWRGPNTLSVTGGGLRWQLGLASTPVTKMLSAVAELTPARAWASPAVLAAIGWLAGAAMRIGKVALQGASPNGQRFQAHPLRVWMVTESTATLDGGHLGPPAPLPEQARLGEFWLPQRGVFAVGRSFFEAFDPVRHVAVRDASR